MLNGNYFGYIAVFKKLLDRESLGFGARETKRVGKFATEKGPKIFLFRVWD